MNHETSDAADAAETTSTHALTTAGQTLAKDARRLRSSTSRFADTVVAALNNALRARPYATVGVAAGLGLVLAGGLRAPLARTMLRIGSRMAVTRAIAALAAPQPRVVSPTTDDPQGEPYGNHASHQG